METTTMETTDRITVPVFDNWYDIAEAAKYNENGERGKIYLRYDPKKRKVTLVTDHPANNSTPEEEWYGRVRVYSIVTKGIVDARTVTKFLASDEGQSLLRRIADGFTVEWDGTNHIGSLNHDAYIADSRLDALLNVRTPHYYIWREDYTEMVDADKPVEPGETAIDAYPNSGVWEAAEFLASMSSEELGISPDMTEEDIEALAVELYEEARDEGHIVRNIKREITYRIEELREEA